MYRLSPDKDIQCIKISIPRRDGKKIPALVLSPKQPGKKSPGVLWLHGGGYFLGMKEMVYMSRAVDLVKKYGAVVVSPGYRLAFAHTYPAAIKDCYDALLYLKNHAGDFGIRQNQIMVGGESAGGGLCAALCILNTCKKPVSRWNWIYTAPVCMPLICCARRSPYPGWQQSVLTGILPMPRSISLRRMGKPLC